MQEGTSTTETFVDKLDEDEAGVIQSKDAKAMRMLKQ